MFDSVDITVRPHQHEWRPARAVHRGFALTDVVTLKLGAHTPTRRNAVDSRGQLCFTVNWREEGDSG